MTYHPWNKGLGEIRAYNRGPMPMEIPRGYKSMRLEVEMSLEKLWAGKGKYLRQFYKPKKTGSFAEANKNNHLGGSFNGETGEGL